MATSLYINQLESATEAVDFVSPSHFTWLGQVPRFVAPPVDGSELPLASIVAATSTALQHQLYSCFYCPGRPIRGEMLDAVDLSSSRYVAEEVMGVLGGKYYDDPGWVISSVGDSFCDVAKSGLTLKIPRATSDKQGLERTVRLPVASEHLHPKFVSVIGSRYQQLFAAGSRIRFYWNVSPLSAADLLCRFEERLNLAGVAFQVKALADPHQYYFRRDALVLYLDQEGVNDALPVLKSEYRRVMRDIAPGTVSFAFECGAGVGIAEDPPGIESFGEHRCKLIARALTRSTSAHGSKMGSVLEEFRALDIEPDKPFRTHGSPQWEGLEL